MMTHEHPPECSSGLGGADGVVAGRRMETVRREVDFFGSSSCRMEKERMDKWIMVGVAAVEDGRLLAEGQQLLWQRVETRE